jgi:hypothetical protein
VRKRKVQKKKSTWPEERKKEKVDWNSPPWLARDKER